MNESSPSYAGRDIGDNLAVCSVKYPRAPPDPYGFIDIFGSTRFWFSINKFIPIVFPSVPVPSDSFWVWEPRFRKSALSTVRISDYDSGDWISRISLFSVKPVGQDSIGHDRRMHPVISEARPGRVASPGTFDSGVT